MIADPRLPTSDSHRSELAPTNDSDARMNLTAEEQAMRAGECGPTAQWAIEHQIKVGDYLGARDFVPVTQAHIMADTESLGEAGVKWLEGLARPPAHGRRGPISTITHPRRTDFAARH